MKEIFLPMLIAFLCTVAIGPFCIKKLLELKVSNTEREELESHQKKMGTPSMGGVMFLSVFAVGCIVLAILGIDAIPVLILTFGCGIIGFIDDYAKVKKRKSDGLKAWQKMLCLIAITILFALYMGMVSKISMELRIPFSSKLIDLGILTYPLLFFAVLGTTNGSNFTDGVDGLCTSVTLIISAFFLFAAVKLEAGIVPVIAVVIGCMMGFLVFNCYPAKVFMGDTGSLALGGFVVGVAYMLQMPVFIIPVAMIYIIEVVSVILQVGYFKMTGGKRIFRMAPIHHHFELGGWSEVKVVAVFTMVTIFLCVFSYFGIAG